MGGSRSTLFIVLLAFLLIFSVSETIAQSGTETQYIAPDESFQLDYPSNWNLNETDNGVLLTTTLGENSLFVMVFGPVGISALTSTADSPAEALEFVKGSLGGTDTVEPFPVDKRDGAISELSTDELDGFLIMLEFGEGEYGLILAAVQAGGDFDLFGPEVMDVVRSFNVVGAQTNGSLGFSLGGDGDDSGLPQTIEGFGDDWRDVIKTMEIEGLIGGGGQLVFNQDYAYFSGTGNWFTPLASNRPHTDIVMAGMLKFDVGTESELELCSLSSRIGRNTEGTAVTYVDVNITNEGGIVVLDKFSESRDAQYDFAPVTVDLSEENHLLFLLQGENLVLYVNGRLVIESFAVKSRAGTYGIALRGRGPSARCEGRNIWVYQAPAFEPGLCKILATKTVNKRGGPGTGYDLAGQMTNGTAIKAVGFNNANDGFRWWQLEDDSWVREDVVTAQGDCLNVPEVAFD